MKIGSKVFSSIWELLFQIIFPGGFLTIQWGWLFAVGAFLISSISLILQKKVLDNKKLYRTIILNCCILALSMFIPVLLGVYIGFLICSAFYSMKIHRDMPKANKITIGTLNIILFLVVAGACGIFIFFWRYLAMYMTAGGLVAGILLYLIFPIRSFIFSIPENLTFKRIKKIGLVSSIIFIVLSSAFVGLGFIRTYNPAPESYTPSGTMDVTIATYNIRQGTGREDNEYDYWKHRKDEVATVIDSFDADFICVQEAFQFQLRYLCSVLETRTYKYIGAGRDDGVIGGEHVAIIFDSARYRVITGGNFWMSEYPYYPSQSWNGRHNANRIFSWARFEEIGTDEQLFVASIHYDSGAEWRENANVMLNERVALYSGGIPALVAGDFNLNTSLSGWDLLENYGTKPLNSSYHLIHGFGHHYNSTFSGFDPGTSTHTSYMIDFIFVCTEVTVNTCDILDDTYLGPDGETHYASDHNPVIATCTI